MAPKGFYVYELVDPQDDAAFYVGKGKGRRAWSHERAAGRGIEPNGLKAERLGNLRRAGLSPIVRIVAEDLSETEAFRLESRLIADGRERLTNIAVGCRSALDAVSAAARDGLADIKPLCVMLQEGADAERLRVWQRVVGGLSRIAAAA